MDPNRVFSDQVSALAVGSDPVVNVYVNVSFYGSLKVNVNVNVKKKFKG